jgi:prevent-host-death family protein
MITMTSLEAQNQFGTLIDSSQREPVVITRRGRPVSVVISVHDLQNMPFSVVQSISTLNPVRGKDAATAMRERLAKMGSQAATDGVTEEDVTRLTHELR